MIVKVMSKQSEIISIGILTALVAFLAIATVGVFMAPVEMDHQAYAYWPPVPVCKYCDPG